MKKQLKAFASGILATVLLIGMIGTAFAAYQKQETLHFNDVKITLDGTALEITDSTGAPTEPFIINGTTYLPLANVARLAGFTVDWEASTKTVKLTSPIEPTQTYITRTGSKYHNNSTCNSGTYWPVPLETATGMGLTPCDKCVN